MTSRTNAARRGRFADRMHEVREGNSHVAPRERRHPATPTGNTSIVIGSWDDCLRCDEPIVLMLTGWAHA